jgi:predicted NBD/HSP70 family sugar kinase
MDTVYQTVQRLPRACKAILRRIQLSGTVTKADLLTVPGTTLTSLNRHMRLLENKGLLREEGHAESSGGRRPVLFGLPRGRPFLLGIDISRSYTQIVAADPALEVLGTRRFRMDSTATPERAVALIASVVDDLLQELGASQSQLIGVGVAAVGPMDSARGTLLAPANFLAPGWENVPLKTMVENALHLPAVVRNGAACAALGEHLFGCGRGADSVSYVNCGIGIRAGFAAGGAVVSPMDSADDAFAHMVVDYGGKLCYCGNTGCVESYCSLQAISENYAAATFRGNRVPFEEICAAAEAGEPVATRIVAEAATAFGWGLANYVNLLAPRLLILSGPVIRASDLFYRVAVETGTRKKRAGSNRTTEYRKDGRFGDSAMACGAAAMASEVLLNPIYQQ